MRFHHDTLTIETVSGRPSYHDIRKNFSIQLIQQVLRMEC